MSLQTALLSSSSFGVVLLKNSPNSVGFVKVSSSSNGRRTVVWCASNTNEKDLVLFQPFEEAKKPEFVVPVSPHMSLSRQLYADECEAAVNEQINAEYSISHAYNAMQAYLDRDNIALKGIAKLFLKICMHKRGHAETLINYQNNRGGRVKLNTIVAPPSDFEHVEKGDALFAMELALSLEKLGHEKLLSLHAVARKNNDPELEEFIESKLLKHQVKGIDKLSNYVSQLREVGKDHGTWNFDQQLSAKQFFFIWV